MKLSFVVYNQNNKSSLEELVILLFKKANNNIEVIIVDNSYDNSINFLYTDFEKEILENKIVVVSVSQTDPNLVRKIAMKYVTGDYVIFSYSSDLFEKNFVDHFLHIVPAINTDIIEFGFSYMGPLKFKWEFSPLLENNRIYNLKTEKNILALSSPFLYSKAFKASFLRRSLSIFELEANMDSFHSYLLLANASSYYFLKKDGIIIDPHIFKFDPIFQILGQWNYLIKYFKSTTAWEETKQYIEYAFIKYMTNIGFEIIDNFLNNTSLKEKIILKINEKVIEEFEETNLNLFIFHDKLLNRAINKKKRKWPALSIKK